MTHWSTSRVLKASSHLPFTWRPSVAISASRGGFSCALAEIAIHGRGGPRVRGSAPRPAWSSATLRRRPRRGGPPPSGRLHARSPESAFVAPRLDRPPTRAETPAMRGTPPRDGAAASRRAMLWRGSGEQTTVPVGHRARHGRPRPRLDRGVQDPRQRRGVGRPVRGRRPRRGLRAPGVRHRGRRLRAGSREPPHPRGRSGRAVGAGRVHRRLRGRRGRAELPPRRGRGTRRPPLRARPRTPPHPGLRVRRPSRSKTCTSWPWVSQT